MDRSNCITPDVAKTLQAHPWTNLSDVVTFTFRSGCDNWFRDLPDQFATLEIP